MDTDFKTHRVDNFNRGRIGDTMQVVTCDAQPRLVGFVGKIDNYIGNKGVWLCSDTGERHWFFNHELKLLSRKNDTQ